MAVSTVYTTRFVAAAGLTSSLIFSVPTGFVAVVTHADVYQGSALTSHSLFLKSFSANWAFGAWVNEGGGNAFTGFWNGRCAFNPGEQFGFESDGSAWDVQATGYLLTLNPGMQLAAA